MNTNITTENLNTDNFIEGSFIIHAAESLINESNEIHKHIVDAYENGEGLSVEELYELRYKLVTIAGTLIYMTKRITYCFKPEFGERLEDLINRIIENDVDEIKNIDNYLKKKVNG